MKIAFFGDIHGKIIDMYNLVSQFERGLGINLETIIQIGDFHAIRDEKDLRDFSAPEKYKSLGDFPLFYRQGKVLKKTFFIGGNHDNNQWHSKYPEGYELIKDLYYLGRSGIRSFDEINVGFVSGNYSEKSFNEHGRGKYNHFTKADIDALINLDKKADVLLFHDWPNIRKLNEGVIKESISHPKNLEFALKRNFGSVELYNLVKELKPRYVFSGHVHMPLEFDTIIENSKIRFIALDKLRDDKNFIYVLDTKNLNVGRYKISRGSLTDPIKETPDLEKAFDYLKNNKLVEARHLFNQLLSEGDNTIKAFSYYGLGASFMKDVRDYSDIDRSIRYFEESLQQLVEHADVHLMLGEALMLKCTIMLQDKKNEEELTKIKNRGILEFREASRLNKGYINHAEESIKRISELK
ncbi:MAG: metallophosphoesterase [Nanoarchaeota archaeon]